MSKHKQGPGVLPDAQSPKTSPAHRPDQNPTLLSSVLDDGHTTILESITDALTLADPSGRIIYHNPASLALHGYASLNEALISPDESFAQWEISDLTGQPLPVENWPLSRALRGESFKRCDLRARRRDTAIEFIGSYSGSLVRSPAGQPRFALLTIRDITERKQAEQRISDLAKFPEENPNPVLRTSFDGQLLYANSAAKTLLHNMKWKEGTLLPDLLRQPVLQVVKQGKHLEFELRCLKQRVYWFRLALIEESGYVNLYARDVTDRIQAQEELQRRQEWLRVTITSIGDAVLATDLDGNIKFLNPVAAALTGWQENEALGRPIQEVFRIINEKTSEPAEDIISRVLREGNTVALANHTALLRRDGQVVPIEDSAAPIRDAEGNLSGAVLVFHDVTEKRHAQEELQRRQEWLRVTLTSIGDAVLATDLDGNIKFLNPVAAALTGWQENEALGRPIQEVFRIINEKTSEPAEDIISRVLREGNTVALANHTALLRRDGQVVPIEDSAAPIRDADGNLSGAVLVFHDVTEKRHAQQALRESEQRVRRKLESVLSPDGDLGVLDLADLIDAPALQKLMDDFYAVARIPMSIIDLKGRLLVGVGWQDICTQFHRAHPLTSQHCHHSDTELSSGLAPGEFRLYKCKNNMWDIATPIFVAGQHVGNIFSGQFFFDDETIDREFFRNQARKYGFDEQQYLDALDRVPRLSRQSIDRGMAFFLKLADTLSQLGHSNVKLARLLAERDRLTASLRQSQAALQESHDQLEQRVQERTFELAHTNEELKAEIAQRHKAEAAVAAERQRLKDVIDMLPAYVVLLDPDYRVPLANRFFEGRFGKSHGKRCYEYLFNLTEPCENCETFKVLKTNAPHHWQWTGPDGRNYDIYDFPFTDSDGSPLIMEVGLDVTETIKAQSALAELNENLERHVTERTEALRQSENRYRSLFSNMSEGFALQEIITDDQGRPCDYRFHEINPAFERLTGLKRNDLLGRRILEVLPKLENYWIENFGRVALTGEPAHFENYSAELNRWYEVFAYQTAPRQFAVVFTDITKRKQTQVNQILLTDILRILNRGGELRPLLAEILHLIRYTTAFDAVGLRLRQGEDYPYFEHNGFSQEFLRLENFLCAKDGDGDIVHNDQGHAVLECTCGLVLSGCTDPTMPCFTKGGSFWTNTATDLLTLPLDADPRTNPRNQCIHLGYESVGLFPIRSAGQIIALLQLNDRRPGRFTPELIAFYENLAQNIGLALQRVEAEDALRASEQRMKFAQEIAHLGNWQLDITRNVLTWSDENHHIFGIPKGTPLSYETFLGSIHPDDRQYVDTQWRAGLRGEPYDIEHRIVVAGDVKWVREKASLEFDETGKLLGGFGITQDITSRKQAEENLQRLNETLEQRVADRTAEVQQQADQLRALANQLSKAEQLERKRLAKILHDHIQQLIVGARLQLGWMERETDPQRLQAAAQGVNAILHEALDASRSLAVDLSPPVLHEAGLIGGLNWLAARLREKNQFTVNLRADNQAEPANEESRLLLFECARELLLNAIKHAGVLEAQITLLRTQPDQIKLIIQDEGKGFDPDLLKNRRPDEVTFGLYSIKERLACIDGHMEFETAPGKGTRITLTAPLGPSDQPSEPTPDTPQTEPRDHTITLRRKPKQIHVLIVDDHRILREGLVRLLQFESDIDVVGEAADGPQAIELADKLQPDVITMDVNLGEMNGVEATQRILARHPHIKIIGLSLHIDKDVADAMRAAGAVAYLTKGGPSEDLIDAIRACASPGPNSPR